MMRQRAVAFGVAFITAASITSSASGSTFEDAAGAAARYLASRQSANGAFGNPQSPADGVAETLSSVVAGGVRGTPISNALGFIGEKGPKRSEEKAGYAARIVMGLRASGQDPKAFARYDFVKTLVSFYNPSTGIYDSTNVYADALSVIGVVAGGEMVPSGAVDYLKANQCATGGFSYTERCTTPADSDTTAIALIALVKAGVPIADASVTQGRRFLDLTQNEDGGFGHEPHKLDPTNANSTGLALSAIAAIGENPRSQPWSNGEKGPLEALMSLRTSEGAFKYKSSDAKANDYATAQAIPGLLGLVPGFRFDPQIASAGSSIATDGTAPLQGSSAKTTDAKATITPPPAAHPDPVIAQDSRQEAKSASVSVVGPNSSPDKICIDSRRKPSGIEALRETGLAITTKDFGGSLGIAVCKISGFGNSAGKCPGTNGYWSYWHELDGKWIEAVEGPSSHHLVRGSMDAWVWAQGGKSKAPPISLLSKTCHQPISRAATKLPGTRGIVLLGVALVSLAGVTRFRTLKRAHR